MILMRIIVQVTMPSGEKLQHTYDLVEMGQVSGFSAMARTVGLTVAICACLVMEGQLTFSSAFYEKIIMNFHILDISVISILW